MITDLSLNPVFNIVIMFSDLKVVVQLFTSPPAVAGFALLAVVVVDVVVICMIVYAMVGFRALGVVWIVGMFVVIPIHGTVFMVMNIAEILMVFVVNMAMAIDMAVDMAILLIVVLVMTMVMTFNVVILPKLLFF